jgi:hypothetical protein
VGLATAKYLSNPGDETAQSLKREAGWPGVAGGLRLVSWGYSLLLVVATLGGGLIRVTADDETAKALALTPDARSWLLLLALAILGVGGLLAITLVLLGQWRCLMYAPQQQAAKEVMLVCITGLGLGSLFLLATGAAGIGYLNWVPSGGTSATQGPSLLVFGGILTLAGAGAILMALVAYTQFLRTLSGCIGDRTGGRGADVTLALAGLLVGATVGAFLCLDPLDPDSSTGLWLGAGWAVWVLGHLWLVAHVRRAVGVALAQLAAPEPGRPAEVVPGSVRTLTLSGLRRLAGAGNR